MKLRKKGKKFNFLKKKKIDWKFIENLKKKLLNELLPNTDPQKDRLSRLFGNEIFKERNLPLAIEFYNLSLSIIEFSRNLERSFCFSNRAQCLLNLKKEKSTLFSCEMALKLVKNHEKSWYRKILVYYSKKDYVGNFYNFKRVSSLGKKLSKIRIFPKIEVLLKTLTRFEREFSKRKFWRKFLDRNRKFSNLILKNPVNCRYSKLLSKKRKKFKNSKQKSSFGFFNILCFLFIIFPDLNINLYYYLTGFYKHLLIITSNSSKIQNNFSIQKKKGVQYFCFYSPTKFSNKLFLKKIQNLIDENRSWYKNELFFFRKMV
mmetsp:Transcript_44113/g.88478  ORF Transcript_44113/g.88478 Transcript_44113/m.88478 type:complete len:317 (-) Transcript_44113:443-1393(-)